MSLRKGSEGTVTSVSERKLRNLYVTLRVELCRFVARSVTPVPGLPANDGAGPRAPSARISRLPHCPMSPSLAASMASNCPDLPRRHPVLPLVS